MKTVKLKENWYVKVPDHFGFWEFARYRFDPVTALLIAGTTMQTAGQIQQGRIAEAEGEIAEDIENYNAAVMEQEANLAEKKGLYEMRKTAKEGERIIGSQIAKMGASGAALGSGAPLRLIEEQMAEIELEKLMIGYEAETEAARALSQAESHRMRGKLAKESGKAAKKASYFGVGSSLLQGFALASMFGGDGTFKSQLKTAVKKPRTTAPNVAKTSFHTKL